jgi:tetratricopeptide (TPR) repeat protein
MSITRIVEDIITALSRNRAFFVISRNTTFTYKGPAVEIANWPTCSPCRTRSRGPSPASWHRASSRPRCSRPDARIRVSSTPGTARCARNWHIRRFTREDLAEARRLLEEAIELDPANAMAFSDLSFAIHFAAVFGWVEDLPGSFARCGEMARRAVAVDDGDANAQTALAIYDLFSGRHEEARRRLRRALDLDPNSTFARGYLGISCAFAGDYEATLPHLEEAMRLSPRDPLANIWPLAKGWAALLSERYKEAVEFATEAAEANGEFPDIYAVLAAAHGQDRRRPGGGGRTRSQERPYAKVRLSARGSVVPRCVLFRR